MSALAFCTLAMNGRIGALAAGVGPVDHPSLWTMRALCVRPTVSDIRFSSFSSSRRTAPHSSRYAYHDKRTEQLAGRGGEFRLASKALCIATQRRVYLHSRYHHHRHYALHQGAFGVEYSRTSRMQVKCSNSALTSSGNKNARGMKDRAPSSAGLPNFV